VIIPAFNAARVLCQQLEAMTAQKPDQGWEIVVVDNGSDDHTVAAANSYASRLPLRVVTETRRGVNCARNRGISNTTGEKILFTDADDIVGPNWVNAMSEAIRPNSVVGGWLDRQHLDPDPPRRLDSAPTSAIFVGDWLPYPIGCCMGWDRSLLERIGNFDSRIKYGGDEVDAAWRAQILGAEMVQAGDDAIIVRRERANLVALRSSLNEFGRSQARLTLRFAPHGHPNLGAARAGLRSLKASFAAVLAKEPDAMEAKKRSIYHRAVARQLLRYELRLDQPPEAARLSL